MEINRNVQIFTDFDATISIHDIGDKFFTQYCLEDCRQAINAWKEGTITSQELFIFECQNTRISEYEFNDFCMEQQIDPYFHQFVNFCQENLFPILILSDGFDGYIQRILKHNKLDFLPFRSNKLIFESDNRIRPEFPYYGKGCMNCANCKGYHIQQQCTQNDLVIYIGDGYSDRCGIEHAKLIFAKDDLKTYCMEKNISFYEFFNFKDVQEQINEIVIKSNFMII